jgi:hypothetical protein
MAEKLSGTQLWLLKQMLRRGDIIFDTLFCWKQAYEKWGPFNGCVHNLRLPTIESLERRGLVRRSAPDFDLRTFRQTITLTDAGRVVAENG